MDAPDKIASDCIARTIERLRALPDYAGRPSWDKIVAEEMAAAFQARTSSHPVTVEMLTAFERQADNMAFVLNHVTLPDQWCDKFTLELEQDRAAIAQMGDGT